MKPLLERISKYFLVFDFEVSRRSNHVIKYLSTWTLSKGDGNVFVAANPVGRDTARSRDQGIWEGPMKSTCFPQVIRIPARMGCTPSKSGLMNQPYFPCQACDSFWSTVPSVSPNRRFSVSRSPKPRIGFYFEKPERRSARCRMWAASHWTTSPAPCRCRGGFQGGGLCFEKLNGASSKIQGWCFLNIQGKVAMSCFDV